MAPTVDQIFNEMMDAASDAFGSGWNAVKKYAPAEFKKMAVQLGEIAENVAKYKIDKTKGYSKETAKILLQMQRRACESVLVATTKLTLIAVQEAIDAIFKILKKAFKGIIASVL